MLGVVTLTNIVIEQRWQKHPKCKFVSNVQKLFTKHSDSFQKILSGIIKNPLIVATLLGIATLGVRELFVYQGANTPINVAKCSPPKPGVTISRRRYAAKRPKTGTVTVRITVEIIGVPLCRI